MQENPIPAIENAELMAKQIVQKAGEDKNTLLRKAREEAERRVAEAVQKAQKESSHMVQTAEQSISTDTAAHISDFEKEKTDFINKAAARENEIADAIIRIISEKTS